MGDNTTLDIMRQYRYLWDMKERKVKIDGTIEKTLRDDLMKIATKDFYGNFSLMLRVALGQFRDRRRRRGVESKSRQAESARSS